jgi:hypothetical protein
MDKDDNVKIRKLGRRYGISVGNEIRKAQGEIYLRDWLITPIGKDERGREQYNYHRIYDIALLDELIRYFRKGNFDRVSAMIVGMYHMKDMFNRDIKTADDQAAEESNFWTREYFK